jgi:hypothetical protein
LTNVEEPYVAFIYELFKSMLFQNSVPFLIS